ncbi:Hypp2808 [Branchiostoma lanceolatum]|uniref:Hypp2808 protein n=1 Tax=Branchiostoma lanceolatum TaxID=7740 RepID=A0A8J9ZW50_BRALA|nr:Hypp2808 [Branchiostoma lanceolatum]
MGVTAQLKFVPRPSPTGLVTAAPTNPSAPKPGNLTWTTTASTKKAPTTVALVTGIPTPGQNVSVVTNSTWSGNQTWVSTTATPLNTAVKMESIAIPAAAAGFMGAICACLVLLVMLHLFLNKKLCFEEVGGFPCFDQKKKEPKAAKLVAVCLMSAPPAFSQKTQQNIPPASSCSGHTSAALLFLSVL